MNEALTLFLMLAIPLIISSALPYVFRHKIREGYESLSAYDVVCDKCRAKHDEIVNRFLEKEDYIFQEETEARKEWHRSLCDKCREMLAEEGF